MRQRHATHDDIEPRTGEDASAKKTPASRRFVGAIAALCVAVALTHVLLVFLHVAPSNPISQRYSKLIDNWVYPFFEQNWLLFAPNPEAIKTRIFARTEGQTASGGRQISNWYDISAADKADITHNPFPSHTTQNMLRRSWLAYQDSRGDDDVSANEWAMVREKYLRNIAVQRFTAHDPRPFQKIQLKVVTQPIAPPDAGDTAQTESYTRTLPWWNVTPDGR